MTDPNKKAKPDTPQKLWEPKEDTMYTLPVGDGWDFQIKRNLIQQSYEVFGVYFNHQFKPSMSIATSVNFIAGVEHEYPQIAPFLNLTKQDVQKLMDQLWLEGLRPSKHLSGDNKKENEMLELAVAKAELVVIKNHLEDMRKILLENLSLLK